MKKIIFFVFSLFIFSTCLKSQVRIRLYYNSNWEITDSTKAVFYREADYDLNNFKLHGEVHDHDLSGNLLMEGNYLNGKRNGDFTFYYDNGEIKNRGEYENNRRTGKWEYYYNNGQLKQVVLFKDSLKHGEWKLVRISDNKFMHSERFKKGKFISARIYNAQSDYYGTMSSEMLNKIPDENSTKLKFTEKFELDTTVYPETLIFSDVETIFKTVTGKEYKIQNREAGYIYGDYSLLEFLAKNVRYPINAINKRITGRVYVGVVIDSNGNTRNVKLVKGVHKDLDDEAQRVVSLVDKWLPAIRDGQPVESPITIPVNFYLNK